MSTELNINTTNKLILLDNGYKYQSSNNYVKMEECFTEFLNKTFFINSDYGKQCKESDKYHIKRLLTILGYYNLSISNEDKSVKYFYHLVRSFNDLEGLKMIGKIKEDNHFYHISLSYYERIVRTYDKCHEDVKRVQKKIESMYASTCDQFKIVSSDSDKIKNISDKFNIFYYEKSCPICHDDFDSNKQNISTKYFNKMLSCVSLRLYS
jgi:hypothetical protein